MSTHQDSNPTTLQNISSNQNMLCISDQDKEKSNKLDKKDNNTIVNNFMAKVVGDGEENPETPTSEENKIPAPRSPPPAPRKRRCGVVMACRKKLDFVDQHKYPQLIIPKEEVLQEFFAASFDQINSRRLLKRRCPCV